MLDFLIDNICVSFGGALFQQVVGIPMAGEAGTWVHIFENL
jgi:hypothetical protein